jgi:hypothetical protein
VAGPHALAAPPRRLLLDVEDATSLGADKRANDLKVQIVLITPALAELALLERVQDRRTAFRIGAETPVASHVGNANRWRCDTAQRSAQRIKKPTRQAVRS